MDTNDTDIRNATNADLPRIHAIYCHYVRNSIVTLAEDEPSPEEMKAMFESIESSHLPFVVAHDTTTENVFGFAYVNKFNNRSGYDRTVECSVYLDPAYTGRRIGKSLLRTVLRGARDMGKSQVVAKISILPERGVMDVPSCKLHISLGFEEVGRLRKVGFKLGKTVDVVMFQLDLSTLEKYL